MCNISRFAKEDMCDSPPPNTNTSNGILYLVIGAVAVVVVALASIGGIIYMRRRHDAAREFVDDAESSRDSTDYSNPSPLHVPEGAREKV